MSKLDAEFGGPDAAAEIDHAPQRRFAFVGIKPQATMGDPAMALDMGRLDDEQAGPRVRQHAKVGQVPVGGAAVDRAVLAHRRNRDTVVQGEPGELERRE